MILETGADPAKHLARPELEIVGWQQCQGALHVIARVAGERLRLCCRQSPNRSANGAIFAIPLDSSALWRGRATERLVALLAGERSKPPDRLLAPTGYQRRRLITALAIIDGLGAGLKVREIAFAVVFPRTAPLTGAAWKGSSERRHTQRLIGEGLRLRGGGYRAFPGFA